MNDFIVNERVSDQILEQFRGKLPDKLLQTWQTFGFGSMSNGFIKIVNPNEYVELLKTVYSSPIDEVAVPIIATGFGDLIVWEDNDIVLIHLRKGISNVLPTDFEFFLDDVYDEYFLNKELNNQNYTEAVNMLGNLAYDECYAYFPLLGVGGVADVENLKKVKIREYITIVSQSLGII
jgi:hypothetical protein